MQVLLAGDHPAIVSEVRRVLLHEGLDCPSANVLGLERIVEELSRRRPDLLVMVLSPDPDHALSVLAEAKDATRGRVVLVGPNVDPKLVVRALRGGADDYVDEEDIEADLVVALGRLNRERAARTGPEGRVAVVLAPSGGSGSSTLAANLAALLAKEHKSSILMDLKLQTGDLAPLLDLKPTHTLADLCQNVTRIDRVMFERSLARHSCGVHLLAAPLLLVDAPLVTAEGVRKTLGLAKLMYTHVIIDLDHSFQPEQMEALRQADTIFIVLRLDFPSLRNARRTLDYLEQMGIPRERIQMVVNRYGQSGEVPYGKAEEALGMKIPHYIPEDARTANRASNEGIPMVIAAPSAKVSRSIAKIAVTINGKQGKP